MTNHHVSSALVTDETIESLLVDGDAGTRTTLQRLVWGMGLDSWQAPKRFCEARRSLAVNSLVDGTAGLGECDWVTGGT